VVQKIADNAKRIRQSPRYYQHAALAGPDAPEANAPGQDLASSSSWRSVTVNDHRTSVQARRLGAQDAVRGPELPSAVDRGYMHHQAHTDQGYRIHREERRAPADHAPPMRKVLHESGLRSSPHGRQQRARTDKDYPPHRRSITHLLSQVAKPDANTDRGASEGDRTRLRHRDYTRSAMDYKHFAKTVREYCSAGDLKRASDLLWSSRDDGKGTPEFLALIDEVFQAALRDRQLLLCAELLQLEKSRREKSTVFMEHCESFLRACDEQRAYQLVSDMFVPICRFGRACLDALSCDAHEIVALACTKHNKMTAVLTKRFKDSYRRVPETMRGRLVHSRTSLRLKAIWQTTHDYSQVQAELGGMSSWLKDIEGEEAMRQLTLTALEIQISANRADLALSTLNRLHQAEGPTSETIALASVMFAKQRAWDSVHRLMDIAQSTASFQIDAHTRRIFNNLIHLYARQHDPVTTWKFVTAAVDKLAFSPNHATTEIVLQCFISHRTLELIPKWLRYLKVTGYRFQLDAKVAAKLLTHYYLECRPSHVLVMWYCRNLINFAPSLAGTEFVDLVKEAVGYDMRYTTAGGKLALREQHASARLELLSQSEGVMPGPGHYRDGELVWPDPKVPSETPNLVEDGEADDFTSSPAFVVGGDSTLSERSRDSTAGHDDTLLRQERVRPTSPGQSSWRLVKSENPHEAERHAVHTESVDGAAKRSSIHNVDEEPLPDEDMGDDTELSGDSFRLLRSSYEDRPYAARQESQFSASIHEGEIDSSNDSADQSVERNMVLALSFDEYDKVLDLYHASLDAVGLPFSPLTLEVAVEASLQRGRGDQSEAEDIIARARRGGMNTACVTGPLLIRQIRRLQNLDRRDVNDLRIAVIDYYRTNDENGLPVQHHVVVAAAATMIDCRKPQYAVNLLDAIYYSDWAAQRPMDMAAMTLYLEAYTALRSRDHLRWVVDTVLQHNLRIDPQFLRRLKAARRQFAREDPLHGPGGSPQARRDLLALVATALEQTQARRAQQMLEAKILGRKLVDVLAKCVNDDLEPAVAVTARLALEDELFGQRVPLGNAPEPVTPIDSAERRAGVGGIVPSEDSPSYLRLKKRVARSIQAEEVLSGRVKRGRRRAVVGVQWLKQYRAFLRRELVMPDGRVTTFKYVLTEDFSSY